MAFSYDESRAPLMVITSRGEATDQQFDAYLAHMSGWLTRGDRYGILFDARGAGRPPPKQRQRQADWMKQNDARLRQCNLGIAFVIDNAIVRGALTAILWLSPMASPHKVVATMDQGEGWLVEVLQSHGLRVPPRSRAGSL